MSYLLFVDESGQDQHDSPHEVLAGIAVEDRDLWNLITAIQALELELFGRRYSEGPRELKAKKILKRKVFRHASQLPPFDPDVRRTLARSCLERGDSAGRDEITALAQAKLAFVERALLVCAQHRCRAFASIVPRGAPRTAGDFLRKDYAYLFERFFYFLEDVGTDAQGLVVFDELDKTMSHILVDQMSQYFRETRPGKVRSALIVPEPFFVHSELTTAVRLADLVAYIVAWGVQVGPMSPVTRQELSNLGELACSLRYRAVRDRDGNPNFTIWSFAVIDDLRSRAGKGLRSWDAPKKRQCRAMPCKASEFSIGKIPKRVNWLGWLEGIV